MNVVDKLIDETSANKSALQTLNEMIDGESPETKSMKNLIVFLRRCIDVIEFMKIISFDGDQDLFQ